jgi:hypothetical protein
VNWTEIKHLIFICSLGTVTTTTPVCTITDGMDSNTFRDVGLRSSTTAILSLTLISLDGMMVFESIPSVIVQTGVVVVTGNFDNRIHTINCKTDEGD